MLAGLKASLSARIVCFGTGILIVGIVFNWLKIKSNFTSFLFFYASYTYSTFL